MARASARPPPAESPKFFAAQAQLPASRPPCQPAIVPKAEMQASKRQNCKPAKPTKLVNRQASHIASYIV